MVPYIAAVSRLALPKRTRGEAGLCGAWSHARPLASGGPGPGEESSDTEPRGGDRLSLAAEHFRGTLRGLVDRNPEGSGDAMERRRLEGEVPGEFGGDGLGDLRLTGVCGALVAAPWWAPETASLDASLRELRPQAAPASDATERLCSLRWRSKAVKPPMVALELDGDKSRTEIAPMVALELVAESWRTEGTGRLLRDDDVSSPVGPL